MSIRERTAWIAIGCTLVIWSYYFIAFGVDVAIRQLDGTQILIRFIACMVLSAAAMMGLAVLTGIVGKTDFDAPPDEMERQIEGRADHLGFRFLETVIPIALIGGLLSVQWIADAFPADPAGATALIFANGILLVLVLTELVREAVHIVWFRMTA